jgi:predicted nucleic acid-binding protein
MEWLSALRGAVVGLDTAPLIYFIEESPEYLHIVRPFFRALDAGELRVVTSALTLTEVLVHPLRRGDSALANQYRRVLLRAKHLDTVVVSHTIAELAAELRSTHGLRTPDAIQLATALASGASSFLTNDARLQLSVRSINIVVLSQLQAPQA